MEDHNRGYVAPHISHLKDAHFQHEVILHGSITTHAMLHGDRLNMQLEVPNHLQTFSSLYTLVTTFISNIPNESPICGEMKAPL
jgi:hypothetical protein